MNIKLNASGLVKKWAGLVEKMGETKSPTSAAWEKDPLFAEVVRLEQWIAEQQAESRRVKHAVVISEISAEHQKAIDLAG